MGSAPLEPHTQAPLLLSLTRCGRLCLVMRNRFVPVPQTLARLTLMGQVKSLERDSQHYQRVRALYLRRLPESEQLFEFTDFVLFEMTPAAVHYVGGFVRAYHFDYQKVVDQIRR